MGPFFGGSTSQNRWQDVCSWINSSGNRHNEIVLRLYWPAGNTLQGDPGAALGQEFYNKIIKPAIQNYGIRNFQVLNELNVEYEPHYSRSKIGGDMVNMAYRIKELAASEGMGAVYLGFPGPGGDALDGPNFEKYWQDYRPYIKWSTPWGYAYNWLAVHSYPTGQSLSDLMQYQYWWLNGNIGELPLRYTEYSIPIVSGDYYARADQCRQAIINLRNYASDKPWVDIWAVFYYLAFDSDAAAQDNVDGRYELVADNGNLTPAQHLANAF